MALYCFARPNTMVEHNFTDDVAIVRAISKKSATKKFSKYYSDIKVCEVFKIKPKDGDVWILTDY